jgi:phage/plasmid-associated DNA primase
LKCHASSKPNWLGRLVTRFVLSTNKLPAFADDSEALGTRTIILKMTKSFAGSENPTLPACVSNRRASVRQ